MKGPAYRIETERLLLRCLEPADAPAMVAAVAASLEHLRPWMPWAVGDPPTFDERVDWLRNQRGRFDLDQDYGYGVFAPDGSELWGACGLHTRAGPGAREIGYWIHVERTGQGYATELAAALTRVAFEVDGVDRVEIRCDPRNVRSAAVPRKLGFPLEATLRRRTPDSEGQPADALLFSLFAADYPGTASAATKLKAFDAIGRRLI
jgi:RimJ/RimL family protein N-acetyltransferase